MERTTTEKAAQALKEEEAWIRASVKDPAAFRPLYERYFKPIFLFIHRRVGDKEISGDLTQQVFLKALNSIGKYQDRGLPFSAWLFRIAHNQCFDYYKQSNRMRMVVMEEEVMENMFEELTADQTRSEWEKKLPNILQQLEPEELHLIEMRFFENRPFREISEILGITENYAKVKTYRVLDKMKKYFIA